MVRVPKLFASIGSTNLTPDMPVAFSIHASTHHWQGDLLDETWAAAEMEYEKAHQTISAYAFFREAFLAMQKIVPPSKDIQIIFQPQENEPLFLPDEEQAYYDAVQLATSKGWGWHENFNENLITGERKTMGGSEPFNLSLSTWEWGGKSLGSSVGFSHFQREGESKADLLLRILETSEKAKQDFPDSIPYTNIYGKIEVDEFKTRVVFGS